MPTDQPTTADCTSRRCPHCGASVRVGWVTCGNSACQEAEFHANRERAAHSRRRRPRRSAT